MADVSTAALKRTGAIAAVGGALAGTVGMAGFAAYTTLTSVIATVAGFGSAVALLGISGWPAILLPVFTASAGYRGGRALSDRFKRKVLLRGEHVALTQALRGWCRSGARIVTRMISLAERREKRLLAVRERAHPENSALIDDWLRRLAAEQQYRQYHLERFERGTENPWVFDDGSGPLGACAAAMLAASRAGILPADLSQERKRLTARISDYTSGLRRRLLHH